MPTTKLSQFSEQPNSRVKSQKDNNWGNKYKYNHFASIVSFSKICQPTQRKATAKTNLHN